jgi:hypothetical protein
MHLPLLQLMHLGCDWKCMSSYKVACRWRPNRPINNSSSSSSTSTTTSSSKSSSTSTSASTAVKSGAEQSLPTASSGSSALQQQQQQQQQQHSQDHTVHIVGAVAPVPEEDEVSFFSMICSTA